VVAYKNKFKYTDMQEKDAQFLDFVVKSLVDKPEAVVIGRTVDEMGVLLTLSVDPEDMGKVIGRQGNTAKAIRTMLRVVGMKNNARVNLKINEPEGSTRMDSRESNLSAQAPTSSAMKTVDEAMEDLNI
jgi:uncharacterized protein